MKKIHLNLLLLLSFNFSYAQSDVLKPTKADLDSICQLIQSTYEVPGMAVGIILDNEVYYSNALGFQDLDSKSPLTSQSLYHMASVSKPFAATAIMQLVEAGKLKLEDKLVDHVPYFTMKDEQYRKITIKQILNHTSGIPDVEDYEWDKPQIDEEAAKRYAKTFESDELDFKPGKDFNYSNAAYDMLANVIAEVSGMTFEAYMMENIFEPLGMKNSTFFKPEVPEALATSPHGMDKDLQMSVMEVYPYNRRHAPSSTLHSNIDDMLKWAMAYLNKGSVDGKRIFSEQVYNALTTPTQKVYKTREMCLSWFTEELDGKRIYYHSGGDEGYRTFFCFFPEEKAAIVVMGNNDYFQSSTAAVHLARNLITNNPNPWKQRIDFALKDMIMKEGIDSCKAFYYNAQMNLSDQYELGGGYIDQLGYWLLDREKYQAALDIFLFNIELFPEDAGFYDSVGDAYIAMENKPKGIEWYKRALEINPKQDFTIKKLKDLEK